VGVYGCDQPIEQRNNRKSKAVCIVAKLKTGVALYCIVGF
jgi:hypothetical protein